MKSLSRLSERALSSRVIHNLRLTPYRCRECREVVRLFDNVCPHCAAAAPAHVGLPTVCLALGLILQAALLYLR